MHIFEILSPSILSSIVATRFSRVPWERQPMDDGVALITGGPVQCTRVIRDGVALIGPPLLRDLRRPQPRDRSAKRYRPMFVRQRSAPNVAFKPLYPRHARDRDHLEYLAVENRSVLRGEQDAKVDPLD